MNNFNANSFSQDTTVVAGFREHLTKVFVWMFLGLLMTTGVTVFLNYSIALNQSWAYSIIQYYYVIFIFEMVVVFILSAKRRTLSPSIVKILFFLYAMLNGLTIGSIVLIYAANSDTGYYIAVQAFLVTSITFGVMAIYGHFTKTDLSGLRNYLFMGLIGIIIFSLLNIFFKSSGLDLIICLAGLFIFIVLTAYDVQRIKKEYTYYASIGDDTGLNNSAIFSALQLYLDFINIFIYILRLLGRKK